MSVYASDINRFHMQDAALAPFSYQKRKKERKKKQVHVQEGTEPNKPFPFVHPFYSSALSRMSSLFRFFQSGALEVHSSLANHMVAKATMKSTLCFQLTRLKMLLDKEQCKESPGYLIPSKHRTILLLWGPI